MYDIRWTCCLLLCGAGAAFGAATFIPGHETSLRCSAQVLGFPPRILSICPSYAIVCGCMSACRRIIIICNTDGIVVLQISIMDVISVAVICKAEGTVLALYRSLQVERMVSIGCGGSQQGSKES
jgi:hypothetical protein